MYEVGVFFYKNEGSESEITPRLSESDLTFFKKQD
jgi:hypothetical protein